VLSDGWFEKIAFFLVLLKDIKDFFGNSIKTIECDGNRQLVMSCFDAASVLLTGCAPFIRENLSVFGETLEKLGNIVIDAFKNKVFLLKFSLDHDSNDVCSFFNSDILSNSCSR
jgi:hypothetical protein